MTYFTGLKLTLKPGMKSNFLRLISAAVICFFIITTCKKDHKTTEFEITDVTVTGNTVKVTGKIMSLSDNPITDFGVCYSTKGNPVATDTAVNLGNPAVGPFSATITNLKRNSTYYFRAFIREANNYLYDEIRNAAIPAIPPSGNSVAAGNITESSATLNGVVNPNGCPSNVSFEYGETTSYGSTATPTENILNGNSDTNVSVVLSTLSPNTVYHFRVRVSNAGGTVYGEDMTFRTRINLVAPLVISAAATNIGNSSATLGTAINPNGSATKVTFEYGTTFLYGSQLDVSADSVKGFVPSSLSIELTGLTPGQLYHFRVKAVSAGGTTNSDDVTFTTTQPPSVTTQDASNLNLTSATMNGQVNANGLNSSITFEYGNTSSYGSSVDGVPVTTSGSENTQVHADLNGLNQNTTYHYRIKATSSAGTTFGADIVFTTTSVTIVVPTLMTSLVTDITQTSAVSGGNITSNGGAAITESGVCWSTSPAPTVNNNKSTDAPDSGTFTSNITALTPGTTYYVRAYATNSSGTGYGQERSFFSASTVTSPTVTTNAVSDITSSSAVSGGNISSDGGEAVTQSGICWSNSPNPTTSGEKTTDGSASGSWSSSMTGLTPSTTYYVKAYAVNGSGTSYGSERSFTTNSAAYTPPDVVIMTATSVTKNSATLNGSVNANGSSTNVTFEYGTTASFGSVITATPNIITGSTPTPVSADITGLDAGQRYYFRVKAISSGSTIYSDDMAFTTMQPPLAVTQDASSVNPASAVLNGYVNANGLSTTITFEYGPTTSYGITVDGTPSTSDGLVNAASSASISGLAASTLYHYRIKATNLAGTTTGSDLTFTTPEVIIETPVLTTTAASVITETTATSGGNITSQGGAPVTQRGICWSTAPNPTTSGSKTDNGSGTGSFTGNLTALTPGTLYYVRAFATNAGGTAYGNTQTFTTTSIVLPIVNSTPASGLTQTAATLNGTVNASGLSSTITFEWGTTISYGNSVAASPGTVTGSTNTAVSASLSGLTQNTAYNYRVKAVSSNGTVYGDNQSFNTLSGVLPAVTTSTITGINSAGATGGGEVINPGSDAVSARGVCWSASANPTTALSTKTVNGSGTGPFSSSIGGLSPSTTYHVRAYATNSTGTAYGSDVTFITTGAAVAPTITTSAITAVGTSSATSGGNITNDGGASITAKGVCWSTTPDPTTAGSKTSEGAGSDSFSSNITGLASGTTYHVRAYATNSAGTSYGQDLSFTTNNVVVIPTVNTAAVSAITTTSASSGGNVIFNGDGTVTERGIYWGTSVNPTAINNKIASGSGTGSFISDIGGLSPGTVYHARAYAINSAGTGYGSDVSFQTLCTAPSASTSAASGVTSTSAILNGAVNANNFSTAVTFQYGLTASYGSTVIPAQSPVTGSSSTPVSVTITGLLPNTVYHFRSAGSNCGGVSNGSDLTFTTLCIASSASTSPASGVTTTSATLNGLVNANNLSASVVFEYGLTASYGSSINATPASVTGSGNTSVNAVVSGLAPGTLYHYRVKSSNCGGTVTGSDLTFTTLCVSPSATTSVATSVASTAATFNGSVTANGSITTVYFQYGTTASYGYSVAATQSPVSGSTPTAVSFNITGLNPNTTYHYRTMAVSCGGTVTGSDGIFTTLCDAPIANAGITTGVSSTAATLNGNVRGRFSSTTVTFEYGTTEAYGFTADANPVTISGDSGTPVNAAISALSPNTLYHYRVKAVNCGGTTYSGDLSFTTSCTLPAATTNAASGISSSSATLNSTVNANNGSSTVTFDYGTTTSYGWSVTATPSPVNGIGSTSVSAVLNGLNQNTTYHYRVRTVNCAGTTLGTDQYFTTTCNAPTATTVPASSTNPVQGQATLNGIVNANGNATTVTFEYGLTTSFGTIVAAGTVYGSSNTNVSALITGLSEGATYYFRVTATSCYGTVYSAYSAANSRFTLDINGNLYHLVTITTGIRFFTTSQTWMKENLKAKQYSDNAALPPGCDTCYIPSPSWMRYGNSDTYADQYGLMYNGATVNGTKNICPTGWHVPTYSEWTTLTDAIGGTSVAGGLLKETAYDHWYSPNTGASDNYGFSARGGGYYNGGFLNLRAISRWWADNTLQYIQMNYNNGEASYATGINDNYFYIRCKK